MKDRPTRVVDYLVSSVHRLGVRHIFGVDGANIEDLYDAMFYSAGAVRGVVAKHEFSATAMADGYHRSSGRLGVVAATSGGGAMNLVPGLTEAYTSRVPVLALVGQPPRALDGDGAFQDQSGSAGAMDAERLFSGITRFCARVEDPASIGELLSRAVAAAQRDPKGPAVLLLPKDVQQAVVDLPPLEPAGDPAPGAERGVDLPPRALELLETARTAPGGVLLLAGDAVARADARTELTRLAELLGAWVAVAPDAHDVFDNRDPRFVGVAGVMGHPSVRDCLDKAAVCVVVGTRMPVLVRGGLEDAFAGKPTVHFGPEPPYPSAFAETGELVTVTGELRGALRAATAALAAHDDGVRMPPPHGGVRPLPLGPPGELGLPYRAAVETIAASLPESANLVTDAGNASAFVVHFVPAPRNGRFLHALGMGGMGYSFGAGIGTAFATGRRTYVLAGDGGFYMHGMEVHTAVEYDLPVTFVIFNNNAHAMCVTREQLLYDDAYTYNAFKPADIGRGVAAMFPSLRATSAGSIAELRSALAEADATDSPALVSVLVDVNEIPPFAPFLQRANVLTTEMGALNDQRPVSAPG